MASMLVKACIGLSTFSSTGKTNASCKDDKHCTKIANKELTRRNGCYDGADQGTSTSKSEAWLEENVNDKISKCNCDWSHVLI